LYIVATLYYPGGSNLDKQSQGFDWLKNYWCDLTGVLAKNGEMNAARPIALIAMLILCSSLGVFWYFLPKLFRNFRYNKALQSLGISSMFITLFLFTDYHDAVINTAGGIGFIVLAFTFTGLYQNKFFTLLYYGLCCLALLMFNYFIYETHRLPEFQPIIQKINFVFFLSWICLMNLLLYYKIKFNN
jgi:hypothetical protein